MKLKNFATCLFLTLLVLRSITASGANNSAVADTTDYYKTDYLQNEDFVYQKYIKSVAVEYEYFTWF